MSLNFRQCPQDSESFLRFISTKILPVVLLCAVFLFGFAYGTKRIYDRTLSSVEQAAFKCNYEQQYFVMSEQLKAEIRSALTAGTPWQTTPASNTTPVVPAGRGVPFSNTANAEGLRKNVAVMSQVDLIANKGGFELAGSDKKFCLAVDAVFERAALDVIGAIEDDTTVEIGEFRNALRALRLAQVAFKDSLWFGRSFQFNQVKRQKKEDDD
jgi:hypothetical protein